MKTSPIATRVVFMVLLTGFLMPLACAQTAPDTGRLIRDQDRASARPPEQTPPLPNFDSAVTAASLPDSGLRMDLRGFRFSGNTLFDAPTLSSVLEAVAGREVGLAELQQAAERISQFYRDRGFFLASAYLPVQEIANGEVEIVVLEGKLGRLRLTNASPLSDALLRGYLANLREGLPLSADSLERSLLLIRSLSGVDLQSSLSPGAEPGSADLDIRVESIDQLNTQFSLDNTGNRFTGSWRASAALGWNSPLRRGDTLSLRASSAGALFNYTRLGYQLPVGADGLQIGAAGSVLSYRLGKDFAALLAHGTAQVISVSTTYPVVRSRRKSLYVQASAEHRRLVDRTDSVQFESDKRLVLLTLAVSGDAVDVWPGGGFTSWGVTYTLGRLNLDAASAALDALGQRAAGGYAKLDFAGTRQQRLTALGHDWRFLGQVSGQRSAGKNLDSSEKFSLGGAQAVRAYPQGEAACDDAWLATLELRHTPAPAWQVLGFVDSAAGTVNHAPLATDTRNRRQISGFGVGANWSVRRGVNLNVSAAWRTGGVPLSDRDRTPRWWAGLQQTL